MEKKKPVHILVTVNGPGEVAGWLTPFAAAMKEIVPEARITAAVTPCVYASGMEAEVAGACDFVDSAWPVRETLKRILRPAAGNGNAPPPPSCLLHMGGEPGVSLALGRRLGVPVLAYSESPFALQNRFDRVFLASETPLYERPLGKNAQKGNPRARVVGNLFVDAAGLHCPDRDHGFSPPLALGIFPGSRPYQIRYMLPFFLKVAGDIRERHPKMRAFLAKADFIEPAFLKEAAENPAASPLAREPARFVADGGLGTLVTERGLSVHIAPPGEVLSRAHLALTVPGTNTAELTALGVPMVVVLPVYWAELNPLPGVLGYLDRLPLAGRYVKRAAALAFLRTWKYVAHPNIRARRQVVPELVGYIRDAEVTRAALSLLDGKLRATSRDLKSILGPGGAAARLAGEVLEHLERVETRTRG